ncbi:MAG: UDP-glucose dehydrogenase family protein [Rhodospirillaceae bacterium]
MKICVQGLWHLGSVTAACMASIGHHVFGLDPDAVTIEKLSRGTAPISEPGLDQLIQAGLDSGRLRFTCDTRLALSDAEVLWVAYDTPVDEDDRADVDYVIAEVRRVLPHLQVGALVLLSSQLPVGSVKRLEHAAAHDFPEKYLTFACSPENLRLGKALEVFMKRDRIIIGARSEADRERLRVMLSALNAPIEWMSVESAEMTKHAINGFLATSVTFANELAAICELVGADAKEVERGLKTESRIGPGAYLSPGAAFAGGTLARDIAFLTSLGREERLTTPLLSSVKFSNDEHKNWARRKLRSLLPKLHESKVAVWGLTYKPGTDTLRRSVAVELCDWLLDMGAYVVVHDPVAREIPARWAGKVERVDSPLAALCDCQALVVATEWPIYREIEGEQITAVAPRIAVFDASRYLARLANVPGINYVAVGSPQQESA